MNGKQIDNLIAEKVMGWKWHEDYAGKGWLNEQTGLFEAREGCFFPSSEYGIKHAWHVVEELTKRDIRVSIRNLNKDRWICELCFHEPIVIHAKTVQMAICLAALKSAGVEIKQI